MIILENHFGNRTSILYEYSNNEKVFASISISIIVRPEPAILLNHPVLRHITDDDQLYRIITKYLS